MTAVEIVLLVLVALALGGVGYLLAQARILRVELRELAETKAELKEVTMDDIGDVLAGHEQRLSELQKGESQLFEFSEQFAEELQDCLRKTSVIRYNPFGDTGGDQSFSVAILTPRGDGVMVSSLHGRAGTRIYAKPVVGGRSRFELTDEEVRALDHALHVRPTNSAPTEGVELKTEDVAA